MSGSIAQFVVPSDAIGNPEAITIDWPNERVYFFNNTGQMRSYSTVFATQNPILSQTTVPTSDTFYGARCDLNGFLIGQWGGGVKCKVWKVDPSTLLAVASFGINETFGNYPDTIGEMAGQFAGLACCSVGTTPYCVIKEGTFSANAGIIRTDNMTAAGFYGTVSSGTQGKSSVCAGGSGSAGSFFFADVNLAGETSLGVYAIYISGSAAGYDIASWPTQNPGITSRKIATIAAATIDASWTTITCNSIGYDNGFVVLDVTEGAGDHDYLVCINGFTGAIVWTLDLGTTLAGIDLSQSRMTSNHLVTVGNGNTAPVEAVQTLSGAANASSVIGLGNSTRSFSSDDVTQNIILEVSYNQSAGSVNPVSGTPTSFHGWAMVDIWSALVFPSPPPVNDEVTVGDLWFGPTDGFVDLAVVANRRLFVGEDGSSSYLGVDGSVPFAVPPPVFLTWSGAGSPNLWSDNAGTGGAFPRSSGNLVAAGSSPPAGRFQLPLVVPANTPQGADPQVRLSVSDDGGRTYSLLQKWRSMGKTGEYTKRLRWLKMGQFRQRTIRLEITDPVRRNIIGVYMDVNEAME
jgi:hypothetical protein